jgi:hypothetical protein
MLIGQPLEDLPGSTPPLARRGQVLPQRGIDPPGRLLHRRDPHRDLALRRHRRRDRLPRRPAVHDISSRRTTPASAAHMPSAEEIVHDN